MSTLAARFFSAGDALRISLCMTPRALARIIFDVGVAEKTSFFVAHRRPLAA